MQVLALISVYTPLVIIVVAVIAVLFSFFWVFVPMPRNGPVASSIQAVAGTATCTAIVRRSLSQIPIM